MPSLPARIRALRIFWDSTWLFPSAKPVESIPSPTSRICFFGEQVTQASKLEALLTCLYLLILTYAYLCLLILTYAYLYLLTYLLTLTYLSLATNGLKLPDLKSKHRNDRCWATF